MTNIEVENGKVNAVLEGGERVEGDRVIVTLSLGVLKAMAANMFSPPLQEEKVKYI